MSFTPVTARRAPVCLASRRIPQLAGYPLARLRAELRGLARRVARRHGPADLEDLVQIGLLTACEVAPRFDPSRGASFLTFVYRRAEGAMIDACRRDRDASGLDIDDLDLGGPSLEDELLHEEQRRRRADALAAVDLRELTEVERQIVEAVVANDGSVAKAGRAVGVCYKTAYARWTKAVTGIRRRVA